MRTSYIAATVLVIVLGLWMASGLINKPADEAEVAAEEAPAESPAMKVEFVEVSLSNKSRNVILQGQLEPAKRLMLRSETSSIVESLNVKRGDRVKAGDTIIQLALEGRGSDYREAEARVKSAVSEQRAAESLRKQGLQSQVQLELAQAQLEAARAQLSRINRDIANIKITAPFDGIINALPLEIGQMIDRGDMVAELVDNASFKVTAQAAQQTIALVESGKEITVELITGEQLPGTLKYIASVADSATRSFEVEAEVENIDGKYSAGVSASLIIPIEQVEAVFISPSTLALGDGGELGVKLVNEYNEVVFNPISLISTSIDGAWVTGIPNNSRVITLGQGFVKAGQVVEPVATQTESEEAS